MNASMAGLSPVRQVAEAMPVRANVVYVEAFEQAAATRDSAPWRVDKECGF